MIDIEILQNAMEVAHHDSPNIPYAIQSRLLSQFTDMKALCHWHPDIECIHVFEGEMYYDVNGIKVLLQAGDSIIVNSHQLHYGYSNNQRECRFSVILFDPELLKSNIYNYQKNVQPIVQSDGITFWLFDRNHPQAPQITEILSKIYDLREQAPDSIDCMLLGLIHCLWHYIYQNSDTSLYQYDNKENSDIELQKKMVAYIHDHYSDDIKLEDIAMAGNISRSKCCRIFQQYLQQSPIAFLNAYRMEISCNLLCNTAYSITDIAISCGYNHLSYFSKKFLQKYHCTPFQYRKTNTQKIMSI